MSTCVTVLTSRVQPPNTDWFAGTKYKFAKLWKDYAAFGNIEEV